MNIKIQISSGVGYMHNVVAGISHALKSRPSWLVRIKFPHMEWRDCITGWRPDGIITEISTAEIYRDVIHENIPIINVSGVMKHLGLPMVHADDIAIGIMAANYLSDLNLRNFAFWGLHAGDFARDRQKAFFDRLKETGIPPENLYLSEYDMPISLEQSNKGLHKWIRKLPKPVGILTSHDAQAYYLTDIARQAGIRVPDEIALLGVDNDANLCELTRPSLSSIALPTTRIGELAVELLEEIITGNKNENKELTVPPIGVIPRGSTEMLAVENMDMVKAIFYMRNNATRGSSVNELLDKIPISRRKLEQLFRKYYSRTPGEEIRRLRVEKARQLLATTTLPMPEIARRSGFSTAEYMGRVFGQATGMSPREFRKNTNSSV